MEKLPFDKYDDDFTLDYKSDDEVTYKDYGEEYVDLYHKDELVAELLVYTDSDADEKREYICINYTIVYLDTLKHQKA